MVQLILILANIFELVESYISANITPNENISISPLQITCAWLSFLATLKLIVFARVCELYDKAGERDFAVQHLNIEYQLCSGIFGVYLHFRAILVLVYK